jgi:putative transposase
MGREERKAAQPRSPFLEFLEHLCYTLLMNELLTRTICIRLDVTGYEAALQETQRRFNEASSWVASVCWQERITNGATAHRRVYGETRSRFGLGAGADRQLRPRQGDGGDQGHKDPGCAADGPLAQGERAAQEQGRETHPAARARHVPSVWPACQHLMLADSDWRIGGAELVWREGVYYLHITQTREAQDVTHTSDAIGVDLGICNVATDSTGEQFTGEVVRKKRAQYVARRAALQGVGTRSATRRLKKMSGRERRWMRDVNHRIAKTLVKKAAVSRKVLALEDLTGIREGEVTVRREHRYERHCWAFFQLRMFLTYKAAWGGVPVYLVDPAYTSQTCSRCGYCAQANRQSQSSFRCQQCGFCCHADYNAAVNISLAVCQAANSSGGMLLATSPSPRGDVGT